jgi:hypothetical protein
MLDISEAQGARQLASTQHHAPRCRVIVSPMGQWNENLALHDRAARCNERGRYGPSSAEFVAIIVLEVADNLPHDRIVLEAGRLMEAHVEPHGGIGGGAREVLRPLNDPLLSRALEICPNIVSAITPPAPALPPPTPTATVTSAASAFTGLAWEGAARRIAESVRGLLAESSQRWAWASAPPPSFSAAFVPTGALALFEELHACFPRHTLLLADFDALPPPDLEWGHGWGARELAASPLASLQAPLVSSRGADGSNRDHPTYLVPEGSADILFPTDFQTLRSLYVGSAGKAGRAAATVTKSRRFFERYPSAAGAACRNGYNPLLVDFVNTSVMVGEARG